MPIDVSRTLAGLDALTLRINDATLQSVADSLHLFQASGMLHAPIGRPGNSTNAPGDLARSIDVEGPVGGDGVYAGQVGPTVIYGRLRELGGDIYKDDGYMHFFTDGGGHYAEGVFGGGPEVYTHHVHQFGAHYMLQAWDEVILSGSVEAVAEGRIAAALLGAQ